MNWIEEQLQYRERIDNEDFSSAIDSIASSVMGRRLHDALSEKEIASSAIDEILIYYHFKPLKEDMPTDFDSIEEQIDYCLRPYGIKSRKVTLDKGWYKYAVGAMLGTLKEDGSLVALLPGKFSGYEFINIKTGECFKLDKKNEKLIDDEAIYFYEPLPQRPLKPIDLVRFALRQINFSDVFFYLLLVITTMLLGLLFPLFNKWLFGEVLESRDVNLLISLAIFMVCFSISRLLFDTFKSLIYSRIGIKQNIAVQAAVMNRIISLPPTFFKKYSSGELSQRSSYVQQLCTTLFGIIGTTVITSIGSLIYIGQIFNFAPSLVLPSLGITFVTILFSLITTFLQMKITKERMEESAKTSGLTYSTITGIQKIKLTGAEKRMFSRWARQYSKEAELNYNPPLYLKISGTISLAISLIGTMIIYIVSIENNIKISDYYAFNTAYGMVSGAFTSLVSILISFADIKPILEMAKPILETEPEIHDKKENIHSLRGEIELSHVSFRYDDSMPNVVDDLSLKIKPGEYLAIVGTTGCGKSTLLRLLLGFEIPQKGIITYDKKNLDKIDLESLRRKMGVVMQDGKLFLGDIYSNIVITAPELGMDAAWEAAEIASIADDIREMPMGMHTIICEGQGGISGGQKQRLMIARAVAPKPKILMLDEATNALDNITQKNVSDAIDKLKCTRIVIAHRLSTIQHADRIICLEGGKIVEEGTYDELIALNGKFAKLVERQRLNVETC